ncbi:MAG: glycosyltransferase family 61 protein [Luteolibacter sp.]
MKFLKPWLGKSSPPRNVRNFITRADSGGRWVSATTPLHLDQLSEDRIHGDVHLYSPFSRIPYNPIIPETGVLFLEGGGTLGVDGWTITSDEDLLIDFSWFRTEEKMRSLGYSPPPIHETYHLRGTCLDLSSTWCAGNYGHWLYDAVGRLAVLDRAGFHMNEFDHIHLPLGKSKQAGDLLDRLGIDRSKFTTPSKKTLFKFETLVRPTLPGGHVHYHPCMADFLRKSANVSTGDSTDRVFLHRSGTNRILSNEAEVLEMLIPRGFRVVNPASARFGEYSNAGIVISCHQAGLADIIFNRPDTQVVELMPSDHQAQYYLSASRTAGHDYHCFVCESTGHRQQNAVGIPSVFDFNANVPKLAALLDKLGCF